MKYLVPLILVGMLILIGCSEETTMENPIAVNELEGLSDSQSHMKQKMEVFNAENFVASNDGLAKVTATITYEGKLCPGVIQGTVAFRSFENSAVWDYYSFFANAGDSPVIEVHRTTSQMDPAMILFFGTTTNNSDVFAPEGAGPNMTFVTFADDNNGIPHGVGGNFEDPRISGITLPSTGLYTLVVFDFSGAGPGRTVPYEIHISGIPSCQIGGGSPANNPPTADAGSDQSVEHSGGSASVTLDGSNSSDPDDDELSYEWTEGGSPIATGVSPTVALVLGSHTITLTVDDGNGGTDTDDVVVEVVNTPPDADAGADQTIECEGLSGANVTLDGFNSSDISGDPLTYEWTEGGSPIASGVSPTLSLGLGTHTITLTVNDGNGGTDSDDVVVTVEDTEDPTVNMTVSLTQLWPPNHTMHLVASGISASDRCCDVTLVVEVTSSELENGDGDGDTDSDWEVVTNPNGTFDVYVRAERSGNGGGRVYIITATATDCANNVTVEVGTVNVPQSKGKRK